MFEKMLQWIKTTILRLMGQENTSLTISPRMENMISLWAKMYEGIGSGGALRLPASIASEFARLVVVESEINLTGSARADWIADQLKPFRGRMREYVEYACALGGAVFKPYISGDGIVIDVVQADCFFPTSFDSSGRLTGAIFTEQITRNGKIYTRVERHSFVRGKETIQNKAFQSNSIASLGGEIPLATVPEWADITPEAEISGIDRPLFAYFKIPLANNKDRHSPLGVSVFSNSVDSIRDADEQYGRLMWEYDGGQMAIDVAASAIRTNQDGSVNMDKREQRLYRRTLEQSKIDGTDFYHAFTPELRDGSYISGLDSILKKIEFQCSLAYGTISDPSTVPRTATELRISKQRSYSAVSDIQHALQNALDDLIYAIDKMATLYQLAPEGSYKTAYNWHDGVLQDEESQRQQDKDDCLNGFSPKWMYNVKWRGMSEQKAREAVTEAQTEVTSSPQLTFESGAEEKAMDLVHTESGKALNGAQTQALIAVIGQYAAGSISIGQAVNIVATAIGISKDEARQIIEGAI